LAGNECLRALFLTNPEDDKERIENMNYGMLDESCAWVFEQPTFRDWVEEDRSQLLWVHGDPGKGKTMLMISGIAKLSIRLKDSNTGLLYFFCDAADDRRNTVIAVLRGILYQLICQYPWMIHYLRKEYDSQANQLFSSPKALLALWRILQNMLGDPACPDIYIMVDALDECDREQLDGFLVLLKRSIPSTQISSEPRSRKVKWLLTSRNVFTIRQHMASGCLDLSLEMYASEVAKAVTIFINDRVRSLAEMKGYSPELREHVKTGLYSRAQGTFLWVAIACRELANPNIRSINTESKLQSLPSGLPALYGRMLRQMTDNEDMTLRDFAQDILRSVIVAARPLKLQELALVAGLPEDRREDLLALREYVDQCGSFLTISQGTVHLVHQSVKDYLLSPSTATVFSPNVDLQHCLIGKRCFQCLCTDPFEKSIEKAGVLEYPLMFWTDHVRDSALDTSSIFDSETHFFQSKSKIRENGFSIYWKGRHRNLEQPHGFTLLHLSAYSGMFWLAKRVLSLDHGDTVNLYDSLERTPLHWAAYSGHESILRLLLDHGAFVDAMGGGTIAALHEVALGGAEASLRLLKLEKAVNSLRADGLDFRAQGGLKRTALHLAATKGHDNVVQTLLEKGAKMEASDRFGWTAMQAAAVGGHLAVLEVLFNHGANHNSKTRDRWTLLHGAASGGHTDVMHVLLKNGVDVNARTSSGRTPLHGAAAWGESANVVHQLLENGADFEAQDLDGERALYLAVSIGDEMSVQLLLEKGASPDTRDFQGASALHAAASSGSLYIVNLLRKYGANMETNDFHGQTMLHQAALGGSDTLVKMLRGMNFDVNAKDEGGRTALHIAAQKGHRGTVEQLLDGGADFAALDQHGVTVLHEAASGGEDAVFQRLLATGAELHLVCKDGKTILHSAVLGGSCRTIRRILEAGLDVQAADCDGLTALHIAAEKGFLDVVQILLDNGAAVEAVDGNKTTVLHKAVCGRHSMLSTLSASISNSHLTSTAPSCDGLIVQDKRCYS